MLLIPILTTLMCPPAIKVNKTKHPWVEIDTISFNNAKEGCVKYYKLSPCLKKFIKKDINNYHAICGHKDEKSN